MTLYAVFLKDHGRNPDRDLVLVKDGFNWGAFLFTVLWAAWSRMWWIAAALFAILTLSGWVLHTAHVSDDVRQIGAVALAAIVGMVGNDLRRWFLERDGYTEVAVIGAKNADEAEQRFLRAADIDGDRIYP